MDTTTTHLSKSILNKIIVKPIRNSNNNCNTCYKCIKRKPKCVCWV